MLDDNLLGRLNDSFSYEPIQYHDSWLSIDPVIGCKLNCQYCYLRTVNWTGVKPQRVASIDEIIQMLHASRYFIPHKTPLSIGNATDSFLVENIEITRGIIRDLENRGYTNTVTLVTKRHIPLDVLTEFQALKYIRPVFFLSYSGLPASVEKGVNPEDNRQNFIALSEYRLPVLHYWRPLVSINGTSEKIEEMLDFVSKYARASIYFGLKSNPALYKLFSANEYLRLPAEYEGKHAEYLLPEIEHRIHALAETKYPDYPLYRHSSCAISYLFGNPDYTITFHNKRICQICSRCPSSQRGICKKADKIPTEADVRLTLHQLGKDLPFRIMTEQVEIDGEITQQDLSYMIHRLNFPIKVGVIYTRMWHGRMFQPGS